MTTTTLRALDPDRIDLWFTFLDDVTDTRLVGRYRALLSAAEREQERRFRLARDGHRYLVTRALLRTVLARYAPVEPAQWRFKTNAYGKPAIDNEFAGAARICFNLSHVGGLIVLALCDGRALGVDAEHPPSRGCGIELAERYFSPDEAAALKALPQSFQQQRFFEYWTLKEAYVKARGMGLSLPLDRFSFEFAESGCIRMHAHGELGDCPSRWRLWQFRVAADYVIGLCAEEPHAAPVEIAVMRTTPMLRDGSVQYVQLGASGQARWPLARS
jgi:4'-phosphopantetheinyl transferase